MILKRSSADNHSLCLFMRSLQSLDSSLQSSLMAQSISAVLSSTLKKVSASKEETDSVVCPDIS